METVQADAGSFLFAYPPTGLVLEALGPPEDNEEAERLSAQEVVALDHVANVANVANVAKPAHKDGLVVRDDGPVGASPMPTTRFVGAHERYLRDRAVDPDLAYREGVRSLDEAQVIRHTGNVTLTGGGLAFSYGPPLPAGWPGHTRVVLDARDANGKKAVIEQTHGRDVPMYVLTTTTKSVASPLFIVESAAKALALASHGWPDAVGLGGVDAGFFNKGTAQIQAHLVDYFPKGRTVYITMDAGQALKPGVAKAGAKIARALLDRGAQPMLVCLPLNEGQDWGPDDFIAARGPDAFASEVRAARPACPLEYARLVAADAGRARALLEDLPFCAAVRLSGPATLKAVAKTLADFHELKEIKAAFRAHKAVKAERANSQGPSRGCGTGAPWEKALLRTESGEVRSCAGNVSLILENDPRWAGGIAFDSLLNDIVFTRSPVGSAATGFLRRTSGSRWVDEDDVALSIWFDREWSIEFGYQKIRPIVALAAHHREFCPVQRRLAALSWDGIPRVDAWLHTYLGAKDTPYVRRAGACWLVSAVARVFVPGCQADYVLVLEGAQRSGKSTALQELAMSLEFYTDQIRDVGAAECEKLLEGKWIIEFSELAAVARGDLEKIKAFITSRTSRYRPSYGRSVRDYPRRCIFVGTVNPIGGHGYLKDPTGNARFWPVATGAEHPIDRAGVRADAEQIWAEAVHLYRTNYCWYPSLAEMRALFEPEQEERSESDAWEAALRRHVRSVPDSIRVRGEERPGYITSETLARDGIGLELARQDSLAVKRIAQIMHRLGWVSCRVRDNDTRFRAWVRTKDAEPAACASARGTLDDEAAVALDGDPDPLGGGADPLRALLS